MVFREAFGFSGFQLAILVSRVNTEKQHFLQNPALVRLLFLVWVCNINICNLSNGTFVFEQG